MIGLLSVLQPDLRNLSMEAKKKNLTALKESAERAIMRLRSIEDQKDTINSHAKYIEAISKSEDVVKPFLQACETKNTKMIIIAVGSIQKLISHNAVASHVLPNVINVLAPLLDMGDDTVQLKVLQTMLTLLTTSNELHGHALAQALGLCFRLHDSKLPSVHHTASATLRQAVAVLFDRTFTEMINDEQGNERKMRAENDTQDQSRPILAPYATDAYLFLQDLCTLTGGDPPAWLPTDHVSRTLGLELIESVLNTHHQLFLDIHEFSVLLKDRVCPLVIKSFKLSTAFPYVVRLYRILNIFIKNFSGLLVAECEVFLSRPIRILEASDSPLWLSTLALEVLKDICNDTDLMKTLYLQNDGRGSENDQPQTNIFQSITNALSTFLHFLFRQDPDVAIKVISIKNKCLDMLTFSEAPAIPLTYPILIALECLAGIVESVGYLAFSNEKQMCIQFANNSWDAMKNLLGIILSKTTDEQLTQNILNVYQSFGNTCATLNLAEPRNAILTSLARQALPAPKEGVEQGDSGITMRHIITLRTIVNIAHKMGDVLESSWGICLEVFDGLDRIIKSTNPIQSLQESGLSYVPAKGHLAAELNSLSASISDIFKNSSKLQNPAIDCILKSLCKISSNALLSNSAQNSAQVVTRIFAVSKIVEIASVNIFRIDKTWDLISDHLRLICNHKNQSIRSIGVDSLTTLITSAFAHESSIKSDSNVTSGPDMQKPFLETLEELSRSSFSDTRLKTLQSLFHILQSSGQSFSKAWPLVLSILMTIAVNNDKAHIPTAFKSVQLICTDFLSNLPLDCLALYITTIGTYAVQGSDINISLTAIGLLWNIADFVAKENPTLTTSSKTSAPQAPRKIGTLSPQDKLWLSAFTEMKQLCSDPRPEVRNCALVTLFKTLTTHGVLLNYGAWAACLSDILFPLLNDVKTASATASSTDSGSNYELGKNGGKSVYMIVHHSRNNAQKQWEETVTIAIGGIVKVFKSYLQTLCDLPDFISSWKTLLDYLESFIESGSREVAVSTIQLLQDFVLANASNTKFTSSLAEPTWEMFERIAFSLTKNAQKKSAMSAILTLAELIKSIVHLSIDTNRLLRILRILGLYHSPDPQHENELSPVQKLVIEMFIKLPKLPDAELPNVFYNLLIFVAAAIGYHYKPPLPEKGTDKGAVLLYTPSLSYLCIAESALSLIVERYKSIENSPIAALIFEDLAKVVGAAIMMKYQTYLSPLWKSAVPAFISIVSIGLPALNKSEIAKNRTLLTVIWTDIADTLEDFLLHDRTTLPKLSPDALKEDEELDVMLADCIAQNMLSGAAHAELLHERLLEILRSGTLLASSNREAFAQACFKNMFYLCSKGGDKDDDHSCHLLIAQLTAPILMKRCKEVLQSFVVDDHQTGQCPLPRYRLAEISFLLQELYKLDLHPDLDILPDKTAKITGTKRHLLHLFPLLCDCITTREETIKERLKAIFHEMAKALSLE